MASSSAQSYNPKESAQSEADPLWRKRRAGESVFAVVVVLLNLTVVIAMMVSTWATDNLWLVGIAFTLFAFGIVFAVVRWARNFARVEYGTQPTEND